MPSLPPLPSPWVGFSIGAGFVSDPVGAVSGGIEGPRRRLLDRGVYPYLFVAVLDGAVSVCLNRSIAPSSAQSR